MAEIGHELMPTTLVGSYPQPDWLIDKEKLLSKGPPRVRMTDVWKVGTEALVQAQDDAVSLTVRELERAGLDILTDGEIRRESYFNQFANALDGLDLDKPGEVLSRLGNPTLVPRVIAPIVRSSPVFLRDAEFLRGQTDRRIKVTVPGPFTMTRLVKDDYYKDEKALLSAYADAVNAELKDLKSAGVDIVQLDEPYLQSNAEEAKENGVWAINQALDGIEGVSAVHLCFGYAYVVKEKPNGYSFLEELDDCRATQISIEAAEPNLDPAVLAALPSKTIVFGVLNMDASVTETSEEVAGRIHGALNHISPERLVIAPDCGMKYLSRDHAHLKVEAMIDGTDLVRQEIAG